MRDTKPLFIDKQNLPHLNRLPHINDTLITAATEVEREITFGLHITTIDENIAEFHEFATHRMEHQFFEAIARITPYGFVSMPLYLMSKGDEPFGVKHRIATCKGYIHVGINDEAIELIDGNGRTSTFVPRLRIMATWAMIFAPRTIERGTKSYAVDRGAVTDVKDAY